MRIKLASTLISSGIDAWVERHIVLKPGKNTIEAVAHGSRGGVKDACEWMVEPEKQFKAGCHAVLRPRTPDSGVSRKAVT
jgi:hypothetical protein